MHRAAGLFVTAKRAYEGVLIEQEEDGVASTLGTSFGEAMHAPLPQRDDERDRGWRLARREPLVNLTRRSCHRWRSARTARRSRIGA